MKSKWHYKEPITIGDEGIITDYRLSKFEKLMALLGPIGFLILMLTAKKRNHENNNT